MTKTDKKELKDLVKEGTIEALRSSEGQDAIAEALKTEKVKDALLDSFVEGFNEIVLPAFEDQHKKINNLKSRVERLEKGGIIS